MPLKKSNRIVHSKDIVTARRFGLYFETENLKLKVVKNKKGYLRLLIVISKKISKRATSRNLLRRRISAVFQDQKILLLNSFDIIITPKSSSILMVKLYTLKAEIIQVMSEIVKKDFTKIKNSFHNKIKQSA